MRYLPFGWLLLVLILLAMTPFVSLGQPAAPAATPPATPAPQPDRVEYTQISVPMPAYLASLGAVFAATWTIAKVRAKDAGRMKAMEERLEQACKFIEEMQK